MSDTNENLWGLGMMAICLIILVGGYMFNAGFFAGGKSVVTEQACTYGSALIKNNPEQLDCYLYQQNLSSHYVLGTNFAADGSGTLGYTTTGWFSYETNYTGVIANVSDIDSQLKEDFGCGYIEIKADEGCLDRIHVVATPTNSTAMTVLESSPNEKFEDASYENYPWPPDFLDEGEAIVYQYCPLVDKDYSWADKGEVNITLTIEIVGCNDNVGDGSCRWDSVVEFVNINRTTSADGDCPAQLDVGDCGTNVTRNHPIFDCTGASGV